MRARGEAARRERTGALYNRRSAPRAERHDVRNRQPRGTACHRVRLDTPIRQHGLQAEELELRGEVLLRQRVPARPRAPALEQIRGQEGDVGPEVVGLDAFLLAGHGNRGLPAKLDG